MSLVNDALQRAKQHTAQPVPVSNLQLLPAESAAKETQPFVRRFPLVLTMLVIVAVALVITGFFRRGDDGEMPAVSASVVKTEPVALALPKTSAPSVEAPGSSPAMEAKVEVPSAPTNPPAMMAQIAALRPLPPKLQAIFFNKAQPSAMINGRTLYVGSRLGNFQVSAITPTSATLVSDTKTNILSFQE
jgi:hypothetical protein